jgi:hypothetical protein
MRVRVVHKDTEICVEDPADMKESNHKFIYYNKDFILILIKEITQNIIKLKYESEKS